MPSFLSIWNRKTGEIRHMDPPRLFLSVSKKAIKSGEPKIPGRCPIALALKNKGYMTVKISVDYLAGTKGNHRYFWTTTKLLKNFMRKFDKTGKGSPFKCWLAKGGVVRLPMFPLTINNPVAVRNLYVWRRNAKGKLYKRWLSKKK